MHLKEPIFWQKKGKFVELSQKNVKTEDVHTGKWLLTAPVNTRLLYRAILPHDEENIHYGLSNENVEVNYPENNKFLCGKQYYNEQKSNSYMRDKTVWYCAVSGNPFKMFEIEKYHGFSRVLLCIGVHGNLKVRQRTYKRHIFKFEYDQQ